VGWEMSEVREKISSFNNLKVYQKSYQLALEIHKITRTFPDIERYELGTQLRRSAVSIPANIAEGYGRKKSNAEFKHFLRNALGSCNEVQVLLSLSKDLGYIADDEYVQQYDELGKQIYRLIEVWK
jgi:four helix bundle protein